MKRLLILGFLLSSFLIRASSFAAEPRPNIVFILLDDLPYAGLSALGNTRIQTPHLDRLAKEGMTFTRAYSEVLCAPSRFSIFTGQCSARHGHTTVGGKEYPHAKMREPELVRRPIGPDGFNLARMMKDAGYRTAIVGKWHMPGVGILPKEAAAFGFDEAVPVNHRAPYKDVVRNFDLAVDFVRRQDGATPFFLYVAPFVTHGPHEVTKEETAAMAAKTGADSKLADMLVTLAKTDESAGRLLSTLDESKLADNTLVLLASDNGAYALERYSELNKPLREGKGSLHEGGIRVPLVARWPGHIKPGSTSASLVHLVDLLPTFAQAAGAEAPADYRLDGKSLMPLLTQQGSFADRTLFLHYPHYVMHWGTTPGDVVVQDRWKLIHHPYDHVTYPGDRKVPGEARYTLGPRTELYDLQADPAERTDLAAQNPEVVAGLMKQLETWLKESGAKQPTDNPDYDAAKVLFNSREAKE
ncbi:MAG: sulfatase-like hydrolase/transferase [Verrucomicrobiae bacterium]|nr:sulfatase-like hydrolase/transferase [Verrucomicrobiae bacterium]